MAPLPRGSSRRRRRRGSASAAEIVAGALVDHERADPRAAHLRQGLGPVDPRRSSAERLKLTTAMYLTPEGRRPHRPGHRAVRSRPTTRDSRTRASASRSRALVEQIASRVADGLLVCELARTGKLLVGEPYFEAATRSSSTGRAQATRPWATSSSLQARPGRARLERVLGPRDGSRPSSRASSGTRAWRPHPPPPAPARRRAGPGRPPRPLAFTIDPEGRRTSTTRSPSRRREATASAPGCTSPTSPPSCPPARRSTATPPSAGFSVYVPGRVAPMLRSELSDDLCSLRPHQDRRCVTVEIPFDADLSPGEPRFYRSLIRSRERLTYGHAQAILAGVERAVDELTGGAPAGGAGLWHGAPRPPLRARGAPRSRGARSSSPSTARAGRAGLDRGEPLAHMLVEELMIAANEAVAELLAGRGREALYRVHERPDPQSVELLLAKLADLEVPTPAVPGAPLAGRGGAARGARERGGHPLRRASRGAGRRRSRRSSSARSSRRVTTRGTSATPAWRAGRTATSRRRSAATPTSWCIALLRELGVLDVEPPEDLADLGDWTSARERAAAEVEYRADDLCLAWLLERRPLRGRLGRDLRGRDRRRDRLRRLRALRRRLRGLPAGAPAARRLLRARPARHRARRPPQRLGLPPRRPDRGQGRRARAVGGQGRAVASRNPPRYFPLFAKIDVGTHLREVTGPFRLPLAPSTGRE